MKKGLPTKTIIFKGKRYTLHECSTNKRAALQEAAHWRRRGYSVRTVTFDGKAYPGALPIKPHYCLYYRYKWPKVR